MDTIKPSEFSISATELSTLLFRESAPLVIDVRKNPAYAASEFILPHAKRRDPEQIALWVKELKTTRSVVVYCVHGHEVSQNAMTILRQHGIGTTYLCGGLENWLSAGHPIINKGVNCIASKNESQV
jgi:thiosulfate sulfurtransferase